MNPLDERSLRRLGVPEQMIADAKAGSHLRCNRAELDIWMREGAQATGSGSPSVIALHLGERLDQLLAAAREVGKVDGLRQAHDEILRAEAHAERSAERLLPLERIEQRHAEFQGIVADCLLWFDGFVAAFAGKSRRKHPRVPERQKLAELNAALQRLAEPSDQEIPF